MGGHGRDEQGKSASCPGMGGDLRRVCSVLTEKASWGWVRVHWILQNCALDVEPLDSPPGTRSGPASPRGITLAGRAPDPLWTRLADGDHPRGTRSGPAAPTRTALDGAELPRSGRSPWVFAGRQLAKTTNPANTASRHPADAPARISSGTPIAPARRPRRDGTPAPAPAAIWAFPPPSPWPRPRPAAPAAACCSCCCPPSPPWLSPFP